MQIFKLEILELSLIFCHTHSLEVSFKDFPWQFFTSVQMATIHGSTAVEIANIVEEKFISFLLL
jgi:hypothetical protein